MQKSSAICPADTGGRKGLCDSRLLFRRMSQATYRFHMPSEECSQEAGIVLHDVQLYFC